MELPLASGASSSNESFSTFRTLTFIEERLPLPITAILTLLTDMLELNPPPFGCDGG